MIKWSEVIKLKVLGGLGLENLAIKNCALLAKWWWRYGEEKDALWRRIIVFKYGKDKWGWLPKRVPRYRLFGIWDVIFSFGDVSNNKGKVFDKSLAFKVGEGSDNRFW